MTQMAGSQGVAFIDGNFLPIKEAKISILDWGLLHSDATYDVVHVWDGQFFRLDDHIQRFFRSAEQLQLKIPYDSKHLKIILAQCVAQANLTHSYVEMAITRGIPELSSRDPRKCKNNFFAFSIPFVWILKNELWKHGLRARISKFKRIPSASIDARIKNYHWLDFTRGLLEAFEYGDETTILSDFDGNITEGPGFNIFASIDGVLCTPVSNILEGITRSTVLLLAEELQLPIIIRNIGTEEFINSSEIFITSTAGGIMPISYVNGIRINEGTPGPLTTAIHDLYWRKKTSGWYGSKVTDLLTMNQFKSEK